MFTLGMSPEQEEREGMQSHAGREALGEGPGGWIGRDAGETAAWARGQGRE